AAPSTTTRRPTCRVRDAVLENVVPPVASCAVPHAERTCRADRISADDPLGGTRGRVPITSAAVSDKGSFAFDHGKMRKTTQPAHPRQSALVDSLQTMTLATAAPASDNS